MTKIAINGLGRIGRAVFKQLVETEQLSWWQSTTLPRRKSSPPQARLGAWPART